MKKLIIFLLLLITTTISSNAQEVEFRTVDYPAIEKMIKDKKSDFYYPTLIDRFQKMDTTMTVEHMYHFYYGKTFQDDFKVFEDLNKTKKVIAIESKNTIPTPKEIKILKDFYTDFYMNKPFSDPKSIEVLAIIYSFEEDTPMVKKIINIYHKLLDALFLTGDGKSMETAIDVISARHEYSILNALRLNSTQQSLLHENNRSYDLLETENEHGEKLNLYFDVTKPFEFYNKKFK
ncbi:DUF4919 domain-containing protein [Faecalibacter rhinopitheci]|uniref:DUF4919 domain-containing protein n=1 Tax=Faecalibacter rhinopitheci TaxID=2779678 RepID=A0A8J7FQV5_9FLAO|nr:DUF4919 domain-containing protein [Faecalibacter rhinopitheci]MBF0597879.1 DUF4919 domain-containing protein [Faecalibacter rhinopitheci]